MLPLLVLLLHHTAVLTAAVVSPAGAGSPGATATVDVGAGVLVRCAGALVRYSLLHYTSSQAGCGPKKSGACSPYISCARHGASP